MEQILISKKDYINRSKSSSPIEGVLFVDYIKELITKRRRRKNPNYGRNHFTLIMHINTFSKLHHAILYTNSINEEFLEDFLDYLLDLNLRQDYIKSLIDSIKGIVKHASTHNYAIDSSYSELEIDSESPYSTYLTNNDIVRLYYFKGLTKKQERIKDLFVVGCLTAMRYSDYSTLSKHNFHDDVIIKKTKKTGITVTVPIHQYVAEIYIKYNYDLVFNLSLQHFNRYVKQICRKVGFNDLKTYSYTKGRTPTVETKEQWELISSHTARRSAATNMLMSGMEPWQIMAITGHTTEKSFFRYIKVTRDNIAKRIAGNNYYLNS